MCFILQISQVIKSTQAFFKEVGMTWLGKE